MISPTYLPHIPPNPYRFTENILIFVIAYPSGKANNMNS